MLKISPVSLSSLADKHLHQWRRGYIYLSAYADVHIRAAEFSPWFNCSWKQFFSNVQADYIEWLLKSKAYIYRVVWVNTLSLWHERHRNKLPWRYPSFSDERSPVEQLFWSPPENNSLLSVAIILHVLLTEVNVGTAQWVLQFSFIPKAIISVFSFSKSPGMHKFTIICIYSWTASL